MANIKLADTVEMHQTQITLEKIRKWASINIGSSVADSMVLERQIVPRIEGMVFNMKADLLTTKLADDKYKAHFYWKLNRKDG